MRTLLINPHYPVSETPSPPLGLAVLAAALEECGAQVEILDFVVTPYDPADLESVIGAFDPQIVGLTCVTMTFETAAEIVRDVRRIAPHVLTVMGGPHVSFLAEPTLRRLSALDCIVCGEGEQTLAALAQAVENGSSMGSIPGLVWRDRERIVDNGPSPTPVDLNAMPPPSRHRIPLGRYRALGLPVSMTTSRGCPHGCIFCAGRNMVGRKVRYRDPHKVVDEMESLGRLGFHQINLADDLFTADPRHCMDVCREIQRRGLSLRWTSFARVDTVSAELLAELRRAGCHTLSFGVESANPDILKTIRKGITPDQAMRAVALCAEAGITPQVSFILGLPGETIETLAETVAFGEKLKALGACHGFHLLAPFPGTDVRCHADRYGIRILSDDWTRYHANRAVVETASVSAAMLDAVAIGWEKKFDEYLGELDRLRKIGSAPQQETWPLTRLEHTIVIYDLMMERAIERQGQWRNGSGPVDPETALSVLADRVSIPASAGYERPQVSKTLAFARSEGYLDLSVEKSFVRWRWVDYL